MRLATDQVLHSYLKQTTMVAGALAKVTHESFVNNLTEISGKFRRYR